MATRPGDGPVVLSVSHPDLCLRVCERCQRGLSLTVFVQEQLVEAQTAGLLADEAVHVLGAVVVHGDGVFQRLDTRLQAEGNLCVPNGVPGGQRRTHNCEFPLCERTRARRRWFKANAHLCPSTVHRAAPHRSGLNRASWGM